MELWYPKDRPMAAGHDTAIAGMGDPKYVGKRPYPCPVDRSVRDFMPDTLAGVVVPVGWAIDRLRRDQAVLSRVREVNENGSLMASIRDDLVNAGATWTDEEVGNSAAPWARRGIA
jgi:protease I